MGNVLILSSIFRPSCHDSQGRLPPKKMSFQLPSLKLTYPLKIGHPERKLIFQPSIFRCEPLVSGSVAKKTPLFCWKKLWSINGLLQRGHVDCCPDSDEVVRHNLRLEDLECRKKVASRQTLGTSSRIQLNFKGLYPMVWGIT